MPAQDREVRAQRIPSPPRRARPLVEPRPPGLAVLAHRRPTCPAVAVARSIREHQAVQAGILVRAATLPILLARRVIGERVEAKPDPRLAQLAKLVVARVRPVKLATRLARLAKLAATRVRPVKLAPRLAPLAKLAATLAQPVKLAPRLVQPAKLAATLVQPVKLATILGVPDKREAMVETQAQLGGAVPNPC